jgi:serine protease AprX
MLTRSILGLAIGAGLSFGAQAAAVVSPDLQERLQTAPTHQVIVTFSDRSQAARLDTLGTTVRHLQELPMAGAVLTTAQVQEVAQWEGVESIYFNAPLDYYNYEAGKITGGHVVHDELKLKGAGVTIAVLDSGVDANHPDLAFGSKTIQNVKIVGDLGVAGVAAYLENQTNTDTSSGHGTHVAGTVAGTGAASAGDARRPNYYAGIAPEAFLVGLGTGEGLNIFFALQGFDYAMANQQRYSIDVITNSWGSKGTAYDPNNPINKASYEAYRRGMVVTFAAGNDGPGDDTLNRYAMVPWVINVGSGTKAGGISSFSSRGVAGDLYKHIDVVAPGSSICSTRAPGTAIGATGPLVNATYPQYTLRYHCISGTSMATPFVAGTTALLLEANPQLSPDQIEEILMQTATPMPGLAFHQVGGGYINVLAAVDLATRTAGNRQAFLNGATSWSSQGYWNKAADGSALISYTGNWTSTAAAAASDGTYKTAAVKKKKATPRVNFVFQGSATQLLYPRDSNGGLADVYVDGVHRGQMSFYSATPDFGGRLPLVNLGNGLHTVEIRGLYGKVYFDGALLDGSLKPFGTTEVEDHKRFTGTMGPSVENLEIDEFPFEVGSDATTIRATISWDGGVDIDFSLVDPEGNEVASGATLANPETLEFHVVQPGTYKYLVKGYATVLANYVLDSTVVRAVVTPQK